MNKQQPMRWKRLVIILGAGFALFLASTQRDTIFLVKWFAYLYYSGWHFLCRSPSFSVGFFES
jgi:hypothetical protein